MADISIHNVQKIEISYFSPTNRNGVELCITTDNGVDRFCFFGNTEALHSIPKADNCVDTTKECDNDLPF